MLNKFILVCIVWTCYCLDRKFCTD